jgi:hypothetical protein
MKLKKKYVVITIAVLLILFAMWLGNRICYYQTGYDIIDIVSGNQIKFVPIDSMDYNGKSITIDDYTIMMEYTRYDTDTGTGYCVFKITRDSGKDVEINISSRNRTTNGFGEYIGSSYDRRFSLGVEASSGIEYKKVGKTLYAYITFYPNYNSGEFAISLSDLSQRDEDGESKTYDFWREEL